MAELEAIEAKKDLQWAMREPRRGYLLHTDSTIQDFNSGMDESVRRNIERGLFKDGKIAFSGRYPRRHGLLGENTGQLEDLHPGTWAIPFRPSDRKDVRQERLAHEAEMRRSRDIIIASVTLGVPGPEDAAFALIFARMGRGARALGPTGGSIGPTRGMALNVVEGSQTAPAKFIRTVKPGETIADLIAEGKSATWVDEAEHAIVSLAGKGKIQRVVVSGGRDGIDFIERGGKLFFEMDSRMVQVRRVIGHTHPRATGPWQGDLDVLGILGQRRSYIIEIGGEPGGTIIRPK